MTPPGAVRQEELRPAPSVWIAPATSAPCRLLQPMLAGSVAWLITFSSESGVICFRAGCPLVSTIHVREVGVDQILLYSQDNLSPVLCHAPVSRA